ncbi:MAG TPA: M15 family metallopeptidase [Caulobacteraceae bacterium]|nr:M15 family metallopeptidase [Caulobacteraceae bacterium]
MRRLRWVHAVGLAAGLVLQTFAGAAAADAPKVKPRYASCGDAAPEFIQAAKKNAETLDTMEWVPFGIPEIGWETYAPLAAREIGTTCGFGTPAFAQALAGFQARFNLPADGVFGQDTFQVFKGVWQERRPFVMARAAGLCPDGPARTELAALPKEEETFEREDRALRADVLDAYRRMVAAARRDLPSLRDDPKLLTLFSGWRDPLDDLFRCAVDGGCDGARRAMCSPHRTGTAIDLNLGWAPDHGADSTNPVNRLHQTRTEAYRWLVKNAARFGFVNYVYEPWHWEWVGESAASATHAAAAAD